MQSKFKRWLICKLGGRVGPCISCRKYAELVSQITRTAETLQAIYVLNDFQDLEPADIQYFIAKIAIANEIAQHLKDSGYIKYEADDEGILRGSLMVVKQI